MSKISDLVENSGQSSRMFDVMTIGARVAELANKASKPVILLSETTPEPDETHAPAPAASARDLEDCALMLRVIDRDQNAFSNLASRYTAAALSLARRILRNQADAEEVVQESLLRVWANAERWKPETLRFSGWFFRIVTNQAISRTRRKPFENLDDVFEPPDFTPGPLEQLEGRQIGGAIRVAIGRLPPRQRAAIALCYDEGLSCAEAAKVMGVSVGTMESLLFRARRSLRAWLGDHAPHGGSNT